MRHLIAVVVLALVVVACGDAGGSDESDTTSAPIAETESSDESLAPDPTTEPVEPSEEASSTTMVERSTEPSEDETTPETVPEDKGIPVTGEVPQEMMSEIVADLNARTGVAETDTTLIRAEQAVWNDGSLGCPKPGEVYTQALVNGYWIVFEHDGDTYDYRASDTGFFKLCEGLGQPPSNPTG